MKTYKIVIFTLVLSAQVVYACKGDGEEVINQKSENGRFSVCVTASSASENYKIDLIEHKGSADLTLSHNDLLFHRDEQLAASLDNNGNFSLVSLMAKDSYQVSLVLHSGEVYVTEACHIIKNDSPVPDIESVAQVVLCRNYPLLTQKLSTAKGESVFEPSQLVFNKSLSSANLSISSAKAFLFSAPQESALTKMYLVQGDAVEVLESKKEWVLIRYISSKAKIIEKWIKVSALL